MATSACSFHGFGVSVLIGAKVRNPSDAERERYASYGSGDFDKSGFQLTLDELSLGWVR
jgi:hypothetical protein